jgi:hypothetical protein
MTSDKGSVAGGFREWALKLVGGSRPATRACPGRRNVFRCAHQDVGVAGRHLDDKTGRPICDQRLDLGQKHWAPVLCLVKLEPLNEP